MEFQRETCVRRAVACVGRCDQSAGKLTAPPSAAAAAAASTASQYQYSNILFEVFECRFFALLTCHFVTFLVSYHL